MKRIINFFLSGTYGDYIMATGALPPLKYCGYQIRVIGVQPYIALLENHPLIDHLVVVPEETAADPIAMCAYADNLLGETGKYFGTNDYWTWSKAPDLIESHTHIVDTYCERLKVPVNRELSIHIPDDIQEWGKQFSDYVLVQAQSFSSPYKQWPIPYWQQLCSRIQSELGLKVMQIGAASDRSIPGLEKVDSPTLKHAIAAIKYARLFIGLDSVFNHATQAIKKPSIILWQSTDPLILGYEQNLNIVNGVEWKPYMKKSAPMLRCQPCYISIWDFYEGTVCDHMMPKEELTESGSSIYLPACQLGNSVDAVFKHVVQFLGQQ